MILSGMVRAGNHGWMGWTGATLAVVVVGLLRVSGPLHAGPLPVVASQWAPSSAQENFSTYINALYRAAGLGAAGLDERVLGLALTGYYALSESQRLSEKQLLSIVDFSQPSSAKRFYVIDLKSRTLVENTWVAHGKNSGETRAAVFSNVADSHMSSLGFYLTEAIYDGKHGLSLRLDGLEPGFNDLARDRAIVMHGAEYVSDTVIEKYGRLGRSFGCPALPVAIAKRVISAIAERTVLFVYAPDAAYLAGSAYLNPALAARGYAQSHAYLADATAPSLP